MAPRRSKSQLQAQLTQHQQLLRSAGLNGTTEKARADLAEAISQGIPLEEFSELVEHLNATTDGGANTANLRVVQLRSPGSEGWIRKGIQRPSCMGNPFPVKEDGKQVRTAAEATALFRPWLAEQLADTTSKQSAWIREVQGLLADGKQVELGCCGDPNCHGHAIAEVITAGVIAHDHPTESTAPDPTPEPPAPTTGELEELLAAAKASGCTIAEQHLHQLVGLPQ